jgi:hypothetical protein
VKCGGNRRRVVMGCLIRDGFGKREITVKEVTILLSIIIYN